MKFIIKETGKEKTFSTRKQVLVNLLAPIKEEFALMSDCLNDAIEKYKDSPLVPYTMTEEDERKLKADPLYIMDIPKYEVEGYDKEIGGIDFDNKLRDEFYNRLMDEDMEIIVFINEHNDKFRVVL